MRDCYSDVGAPSVDPVVIFKMSLLGYFYGISSERRLAEECRYNLAFKWFLRYDIDEMTPDHSIFSKVRARFGMGTFEQFFAEIVRKCRDKGLMDGDRVFLDATLLRANASRKSIVKRGQYLELKQTPREYLDALWRENPAEEDDPPDPKGQGGDSSPGGSRKVKTNEAVVSKTDPDASLVARRGTGPMLAHKVHIAVADGKARIVTAVTATPGAVQEHEAVERLLQKHRFITHEKPGTRRGLGLRGQEGVHPPGQARPSLKSLRARLSPKTLSEYLRGILGLLSMTSPPLSVLLDTKHFHGQARSSFCLLEVPIS